MRDYDEQTMVLPGVGIGERRAGVDRRRRQEPIAATGERRAGVERRRRRARRRRGVRALILLLAAAVVAASGYVAYTSLRPTLDSLRVSDDYTGAGTGKVEVTIAEGASGRTIARTLADAGVVKTATSFVDAVTKDPKAASIAPGTYSLRKQMSASAAVSLLLDPASRALKKVTVREGLRVGEVVSLLAKSTGQPASAYAAALKKPAALGVPASAKGKVEGWLFPASYEFDRKATAAEQLSTMVAQTKKVLAEVRVPAGDAERVLTVASIAEVEAASPGDYAKVARTLDNRLRAGMKLQLDSTVSYAVGKRTITTTDAERATRSPYNTYVVDGLPAGPISNPGKAAILGAVKPAPGSWLFFVTVDPSTGATRFATTEAEHAKNVAMFQSWCRAHPGKC